MDYQTYIDFEKKEANFKDGRFVELLNEIYEQHLGEYFWPALSSPEETILNHDSGENQYYYKYEPSSVLFDIFISPPDVPQTDDELAGLMANDAGKVEYRSFQNYGISANSQDKELAWTFIKFMMGEEAQKELQFELIGDPINNNAFDEALKRDKHLYNKDEYRRAYDDYIACMNGFADGLNYYAITDKVIDEMIMTEIRRFFRGESNADDTAGVLQNKVQLYLNE